MNIRLAVFTLLFALPVIADDHLAIVERAFANISQEYLQVWAFTESVTEEEVTSIGRYDPRLAGDARWNLLTVDDRPPTENEIADYQDDRTDRFRDDVEGTIDIIDLESLALVEETDEHWIFSFVPNGDDDEDEAAMEFMRNVNGTLKIVRDGHYPEYIDLQNDKPIKPAFGVKISRFQTRLTFGPAGDKGPIVPLTIDVEVKGRAMLVIKFHEIESAHYGNYDNVGP